MVRALAGDSTMTRFFGTAGSVAPGPARTLHRRSTTRRSRTEARGEPVRARHGARAGFRPRGCGGGSPRRSRGRHRRRRRRRRSVSGSTPTATGTGIGRPVSAAAAGGISTNRMCRYGKKKTEAIASTKTGRLPFIIRRFVQRRPTSLFPGSSNRSASSGCSLLRWRIALRITDASCARAVPSGEGPDGPGLGVVEVDDEADPPRRHPHADAHAVVLAVHHVDVVAAVVRLLALEVAVAAQDGAVRVARTAAEVLRPACSWCSRLGEAGRPGCRR